MVDSGDSDSAVTMEQPSADDAAAGEEDEPTADKEFLEWVSEVTHDKISSAVGKSPNTICRECDWQPGSRKALRRHAPHHWIRVYCLCGFGHVSPDMTVRHQRTARKAKIADDHGRDSGQVNTVDRLGYPTFCEAMKIRNPPGFLRIPHLGRGCSQQVRRRPELSV